MSATKAPIVKRYPWERITVHNATGAKLEAGRVVKHAGSETDGIPNVELTSGQDDTPLGVLLEDIENGKKGVCAVAGEVDVQVSGDVTPGRFAGLSDVTGQEGRVRVLDVAALGDQASGVQGLKIRCYIGVFIGGIGTQVAGDKVRMKICHGIYMDSDYGEV